MAVLSVVGMLGGAGVYLISRGSGKDESAWLLAGSVFAGMQPYTLKLLMPINMRILNDKLPEEEACDTMDRWWNYHLWRTLAASGTFICLAYAIAKK